MLRYLLVSLFLLSATCAKAQPQFIIVGPDSFMHEGLLKEGIAAYRDSLVRTPMHPYFNYNLACAYAISGQHDSAFRFLRIAMQADSATFYTVLTDPDLISLKEHKDWKSIEDLAVASLVAKKKTPVKDREYASTLWKMRALDQAYYSDLRILDKRIGKNSSVSRSIWKLKSMINNQNQKDLESLIARKGWPKISQVGSSAADAAFLIIQHSDAAKQKKYLPTIEALCKQQEADWESYVLMYDRIQTDENKPQKYGSQVKYNPDTKKYELFPLLDASKVDEWRKEMGMGPLADYVSGWDIKFEPPAK